mmetsp:Transcript_16213/g.32012  ORF Transcript_16213/g.32012 Transcript_16213/m.32012 type:complete len:103 (+) Transcript_16213:200-508(+)
MKGILYNHNEPSVPCSRSDDEIAVFELLWPGVWFGSPQWGLSCSCAGQPPLPDNWFECSEWSQRTKRAYGRGVIFEEDLKMMELSVFNKLFPSCVGQALPEC